MPNSLEIFENTLLQLITRQGTNNDRKNIVLKSGELGYATDAKRLFIGDGSTSGGNAVGSLFLGNTTNLTTLNAGLPGDIAFKTDDASLYTILSGDGKNILNWSKISGNITPANGSISITAGNKISVASISAGMVSPQLLGTSMALDTSNKLTLASTIQVGSITTNNNAFLQLPRFISVASNNYTLPAGGLGNNKYLKTTADGQLSWSELGSNVSYFAYNTGGIIPVGTVISTLTASNLNADWVLCNGQTLTTSNYQELYDVIGTTYGGTAAAFRVPNFTRDMLYGTSSSPWNSTLIALASASSNAVLSAAAVNFFIKAKPDRVIKGSLRVNSPLNMTLNGVSRRDTAIPALTTLDSAVELSLPTSTIRVNSPLSLTKDGASQTGNVVSIYDGAMVVNGPTNTLEVDSPLKITIDSIDRTGIPVSPYSGNINITLNTTNKIKVSSPLANGQRLLKLTAGGVDKTSTSAELDSQNGDITITLDEKALTDHLFPVGSIFFSITNLNPCDEFGNGRFSGTKWRQVANGRFIAGVGIGRDSNNDSLTINSGGSNYGEYTHRLTIPEMPSHKHDTYAQPTRDGDDGGGRDWNPYSVLTASSYTGDDQPHNNVPPGFGLYVWQRTS
jgi:microcystin-dependent protein